MPEDKDVTADERKEACERNDVARGRSLFLLWGPPVALTILASALYQSGLSFTLAALLWTGSTAWIGVACLINAARCGRVHCIIDGTLLPLLSVAGIMSLLGIIPFDWNLYGAFFWAILISSFLAEWLWRPYVFVNESHKDMIQPEARSCC